MTEVPEGAERSEDGQWWWDGSTWQPVAASDAQDPQGSGAADEPPEITADDLHPVGDTDPAPGRADLLTERLKPYFEPNGDDVPDDETEAEVTASLDEDRFTGPAEG